MQGPTVPMNMIGLISLMIQSFGLLVLMGGAWSLSKQLTTLVIKLEILASLPKELIELKLEFTKLKSDVEALWKSHREFCINTEKKESDEWRKIELLLENLDKRRDNDS